ncbi:Holliday junction branch migration DNA helicase RuvB [Photobacterium kishitanii]|uniref:Holliday junction branch migration complex subunit RuvB n=1 Tax=Photobacterium kishitanii TaxID=318456 RepID=A0A2T3KMY8_9GAMM|nr:Holliday junction branch migration DNA helicase RuvB [Photobacterium kishitanii]PSV01166.1 Holliday junction branch migration DNA helicase RuvB [Photobacterium kishitanii]
MSADNEQSNRPISFKEYIGQRKIITQLEVSVKAAMTRKSASMNDDVVDHIIIDGMPGLGKTSLAFVVAHELGVNVKVIQANSLEKLGDLAAVVMTIEHGDVLFIDEIHALRPQLEEMLYSIMEDFRFDIVVESQEGGIGAPINMSIPRFTLIGATTELGRVKKPLLDRFTHSYTLDPYTTKELKQIIDYYKIKFSCEIDEIAASMIAQASKGVPRICISHLKKCRDYAQADGRFEIVGEDVSKAFSDASIQSDGLKKNDLKYLTALYRHNHATGNPAGIKLISDLSGIHQRTIEDAVEPYLLQEGIVMKTPRGRVITDKGILILKTSNDQ